MTAAIFGLVGVVLGAALNVLLAEVAAWRRERQAGRTAARLTLAELSGNHRRIKSAVDKKAWDELATEGIKTDEWFGHRELFAEALEHDDWTLLANAYGRLQLVGRWRDAEAKDEQTAINLGQAVAMTLVNSEAKEAYELLASISRR